MKVLFVCKANVGRSQMAEAIFNKLAGDKAVASNAGADSETYEGHKLKAVAPLVTRCMNDIGIDVSKKVSKPISKDKTDEADVIVSMVDKSKLPEYLQNSDKLILWNIEDPKNMDYDGHVKIRNMIYKKVQALIKDIIK